MIINYLMRSPGEHIENKPILNIPIRYSYTCQSCQSLFENCPELPHVDQYNNPLCESCLCLRLWHFFLDDFKNFDFNTIKYISSAKIYKNWVFHSAWDNILSSIKLRVKGRKYDLLYFTPSPLIFLGARVGVIDFFRNHPFAPNQTKGNNGGLSRWI